MFKSVTDEHISILVFHIEIHIMQLFQVIQSIC